MAQVKPPGQEKIRVLEYGNRKPENEGILRQLYFNVRKIRRDT
jgi:hypothetical protein